MKKNLFIIVLVLFATQAFTQNYFRSGIFLHHSTGQNIWGPNGSATSVPQEMDAYNFSHSYIGSQAVTMNEEWWAPGDNEWVTQHAFFEDPSPVTGIGFYLPDNKIIVIKSCFPSSAISGTGQPDDTLNPDWKTIYNYKWHWRHIIRVMQLHPENFFVIWTNAPLEPYSTIPEEAALSKSFCIWAKDTLAMGLDPLFGAFPQNVYVFDFFHKLTGDNGMMLSMYAVGAGDSHPNAAATSLVAPQFVEEIFNASIGYEGINGLVPKDVRKENRLTSDPNPFESETLIRFRITARKQAELSLLDVSGKKIKTIWTGRQKGDYLIPLSGEDMKSGTYLLQLVEENTIQVIYKILRK